MVKARNILMLIIILIIISGCNQTASVPSETTETGGTFGEWKEKIQDNPEALLKADECKKLIDNTAISCKQHEGFTVNNIMEITDFKADEPYSFQETIKGGCDSALAVSEKHEPKATTIHYGTEGSSSYQVVCSSVCVWWQCKDEKQSEPVKIVVKDKPKNKDNLQVVSGAPSCPKGNGGFTLGSPDIDKKPEKYIPPYLIGSWGNEAYLFCDYMRNTGKKEYDGSVIYETAFLSAQYQTSGTFEARPDWARESYCTGTNNKRYNNQQYEGNDDIYSGSHVSRIIYSAVSYDNKDISEIMKTMADTLASQIETTPYAITCP